MNPGARPYILAHTFSHSSPAGCRVCNRISCSDKSDRSTDWREWIVADRIISGAREPDARITGRRFQAFALSVLVRPFRCNTAYCSMDRANTSLVS